MGKIQSRMVQFLFLGLVAFLLVQCTGMESIPTRVDSPTATNDYQPPSTPTVEGIPEASTTPRRDLDQWQAPPDYRIEEADFLYEFFDLPTRNLGKRLIAYWIPDEENFYSGGSLEYLTSTGEKGLLFEVTFQPELHDQYWLEGMRSDGYSGTIADGNSFLIHRRDDSGRRYAYLVDLKLKTISGISFLLKDDLECDFWSLSDEYLIWACDNPHTDYYDTYYGDYVYYFFLIPLDRPEEVLFIGSQSGAYPKRYFTQCNTRLFFQGTRNNYCALALDDLTFACGEESPEFYFGPYLSPDGKWMEVHPRSKNHPQKIGLLSMDCIGNSDQPCDPKQIISISQIMENWNSDCRDIWHGTWTEDSQSIIWLTQPWFGAAGETPCEAEFLRQELWKYNLSDQTLEKINQFEVLEEKAGDDVPENMYYYITQSTPIWFQNGKSVVVIQGPRSGNLVRYYLLSAENGSLSFLGELPGYHMGEVIISSSQ